MFSSFGVSAILGSIFVRFLQYKIGYFGMLTVSMSLTLLAFGLTFAYKSQSKYNYS
jgi:hypothetical protein